MVSIMACAAVLAAHAYASGKNFKKGAATPLCLALPVPPASWVVTENGKFRDPLHPFRIMIGADGKKYVDEHNGIDVGVQSGTKVFAADDGVVTWVGPDSTGANIIAVEMAGGWQYRYGHLSVMKVKRGQRVRRGRLIGLSGGAIGIPGSGTFTTGPHLHVELLDEKMRYVDPFPHFCEPTRP
jgi:murein DD-endopeptidase MepM/ murein hydrolase activator NlpD